MGLGLGLNEGFDDKLLEFVNGQCEPHDLIYIKDWIDKFAEISAKYLSRVDELKQELEEAERSLSMDIQSKLRQLNDAITDTTNDRKYS